MGVSVGSEINFGLPHPGGFVTAEVTLGGVPVPSEVVDLGDAVRLLVAPDRPGVYLVRWARDGAAWREDTLRVVPREDALLRPTPGGTPSTGSIGGVAG